MYDNVGVLRRARSTYETPFRCSGQALLRYPSLDVASDVAICVRDSETLLVESAFDSSGRYIAILCMCKTKILHLPHYCNK